MSNYNKIKKLDIANGPGIRVSVFFQGCHFHCPDCFNSETWDFSKGKPFSGETINYILDLCSPHYIAGLSILGGEPLNPKNIEAVYELSKNFKEKYPMKDIWLWTGYQYEYLISEERKEELRKEGIEKNLTAELFSVVDVLIDGPFVSSLKDINLAFAGSSNQRMIRLKTESK